MVRSKKYSAETIADADYGDDLAFMANTPAQVESLMHSQEQAARSTGLYVKTNKMCFNQDGDNSSLSGKALKSIDQFTYIGNNIGRK